MLYVVRHGKTGWNDKKRTMGCMDIPLCDEGIEQAKELKDKLEKINIDLIICSPLTRAKETANIINEDKNVEIKIENKIVERSMGDLECSNYPSYEENERIWSLEENTDDYYIEPMVNFKNRIYNYLDKLVEQYNDKDVLLVTHGGVTALINCYFNNSLEEGSITNKFLENGVIESYNMKKGKRLILKPEEKIEG